MRKACWSIRSQMRGDMSSRSKMAKTKLGTDGEQGVAKAEILEWLHATKRDAKGGWVYLEPGAQGYIDKILRYYLIALASVIL